MAEAAPKETSGPGIKLSLHSAGYPKKVIRETFALPMSSLARNLQWRLKLNLLDRMACRHDGKKDSS